MSPRRRLLAAAFLLAVLSTPAHAGKLRTYSLSYELSYGRHPARATFLKEIEGSVAAWVAAGGPRDAPIAKGEADLHLHLVFHDILLERQYPEVSGSADTFSEGALPTYTFSTFFEVEIRLVDARREEFPVAERELSLFNEQGYTKLISDPKQYSWDTNVKFLLDRINSLLKRNRKKIAGYLRDQAAGE